MSHKKGAWGNYYILQIRSDKVIQSATNAYQTRYPRHEIMTLKTSKGQATGGTLLDGSNPLSSAELSDKLIVVAHGNPLSIGGLTPGQFSRCLKAGGLTHIGLIAFKSCLVGSDTFLDDLSKEVETYAYVGYYVGYKGTSITMRRGLKGIFLGGKKSGKFSEIVSGIDDFLSLFGRKASDKHRVYVLAGNAAHKVKYLRFAEAFVD